MAMGMKPILLATPVGSNRGIDYDYWPIPIERFRFHPLLDPWLFVTVLRLLLKEKPQAAHLISLKPYLYGGLAARLARLFGWKGGVVVTVPGLGRLYDEVNTSLRARLRRAAVEFFLRIATHDARVTFETEHDRDFWIARRLIAPEQAMVTRGAGIDLARFSNSRPRRETAKLRVLFASRLLRSKGLGVFLRAARLIDDLCIEMLVAGFSEDDPDTVPLDELRANRNIRFLGAVDDMPALLTRTDVVVLPSRYNEGVPRILLEAAACGCVPIATRFAGSEALIRPSETGFFLEAGTPDAQARELVELIRKLARDETRRQAIGAGAAAHVRGGNGFSSEEVAAAFLGLYAAS